MKRISIALFATAAALAVTAARADTRVSIGVNFGGPAYHPAPPTVVCAPVPVVVAPARGYWTDVTVKTWVPERWIVSRDRWGRPIRMCEPGYFTYRTDRVWVDGRHDHDRHDHRHAHDRRDGWRR